MSDSTVLFSRLCAFFEKMERVKVAQKRTLTKAFLDVVYAPGANYFSLLRLVLPGLDKERPNYGLKEAVLAKHLTEAVGLSKDSADAQKLLNWRRGGTRVGDNAGNFARVAYDTLKTRQQVATKELKIKDINDLLDRLAMADKSAEKVAVLTEMICKTNALEMRWIIVIILKDLKLHMSDKTVFGAFHPDAEHLFNVTCDLKLVCEKLKDRSARFERQDIVVGKAVKPQLATRVANVEEAWKKLRGKQITVECKFDGDRIQLHKDGTSFHFFSRTFNDHQVFMEGMADVLSRNIIPDKCILDGEMLVWDRLTNHFAAFGSNREAAKSAKDGVETNQQLCYVAFDLLYHESTSVIHLPLRERQEQLRKAVRPVRGRLELLNPTSSLNSQTSKGEPKWSIIATSAEEVQRYFQETVDNRDEGIILKDLDSKWDPNDRSGKWLKLKPDYVQTGSDLDVLIIGGYYGSGRRGGQIAQFLLGIAEKAKGAEYPTKFSSFCKVGTGLTDEECDHLVQKLNPYLRRYEKNTKPPDCYVVTNNAKERPDVWVDQPDKSVILQIASDIRTIQTDVFAAPYALRFPRVTRVRYDKPWYDCLEMDALVEMVNAEGKGAMDLTGGGNSDKKQNQRKRPKKADIQLRPLVPSHMRVTDVSNVKRENQIFTKQDYSVDSFRKLVFSNGGSFSMNPDKDVTHNIASEKKGVKFEASKRSDQDVIHYSWVLDCCQAKTLLPVTPKYFLHLSKQTKEKMKAHMDVLGDLYFVDIDTADLSQLFENMDPDKLATDGDEIAHYQKKYCPASAFSQFSDCLVYFHKPIHSSNPDSQMIAEATLNRQKLEVSMHAGVVSKELSRDVTHMIVFTSSENTLPFRTIWKSVCPQNRWLLQSDKLKILSHRWIEDHVPDNGGHPSDEEYDLRDPSFPFEEQEMIVISTIANHSNPDGGQRRGDKIKAEREEGIYANSAEPGESHAKQSPRTESIESGKPLKTEIKVKAEDTSAKEANGRSRPKRRVDTNSAEQGEDQAKRSPTTKSIKSGKRLKAEDNPKAEDSSADEVNGRHHPERTTTFSAALDGRPQPRLVTVERPSKTRKRQRNVDTRRRVLDDSTTVEAASNAGTAAVETGIDEDPNGPVPGDGQSVPFEGGTTEIQHGSDDRHAELGDRPQGPPDRPVGVEVATPSNEAFLDAMMNDLMPGQGASDPGASSRAPSRGHAETSAIPVSVEFDTHPVELPRRPVADMQPRLPDPTDEDHIQPSTPAKKKVSYRSVVSGLLQK